MALNAGQFSQARVLARAALAGAKDDPAHWTDLAGVYYVAEGYLELAEQVFDEAISQFDSASLYSLRAWIHRTAKRNDCALLDLQEAERRDPDSLMIQNNIAALLVD